MNPSISVALLGHNSIIREGLRRILADENFCITQSVDNPSRLSNDDDDLLVIVDGGFEGADAEGIRRLRERFPSTKLVLLSEAFDLPAMVSAFRAGIHGYIVKEISCEPLIGSLRLVAMGEKVMPSNLADVLPFHDANGHRERDRQTLENANLSVREVEILTFLIMGCPNKVISRRLAISEATVKVHVKAILRKLCVRNRTQAAIRAVNAGLDPKLDRDGTDIFEKLEDEEAGSGAQSHQGEMMLPFAPYSTEPHGAAGSRPKPKWMDIDRSVAVLLVGSVAMRVWDVTAVSALVA